MSASTTSAPPRELERFVRPPPETSKPPVENGANARRAFVSSSTTRMRLGHCRGGNTAGGVLWRRAKRPPVSGSAQTLRPSPWVDAVLPGGWGLPPAPAPWRGYPEWSARESILEELKRYVGSASDAQAFALAASPRRATLRPDRAGVLRPHPGQPEAGRSCRAARARWASQTTVR
jgi:hypothetical protein